MNHLLSLLEAFPEAILRLKEGSVLSVNPTARTLLPHLEQGGGLPSSMALLNSLSRGSGVFTEAGRVWSFSASRIGEERLILFRPAPFPVLTVRELEGTVRQLRGLLGDVMAEMGPLTAKGARAPAQATQADFTRSCYRMARLVGNLDYVRQSAAGGVEFRPERVDLAKLCGDLAREAGDLLRGVDTDLWYDAQLTALLVPGDPGLLQRLLLGLIANSAQAAKGGSVVLSLGTREDRAVLSLSDSGGALDDRGKDALLQREEGGRIPLPGQGAGLGLSIARDIVALHRGSMLVDLGEEDRPSILISLPTGPLPPGVTVRSPAADLSGGLDPLLVELSDVLSSEPYGVEGLE